MLKRITPEEAEQFIPCAEDYSGGFENAAFFTFTPSKNPPFGEQDWDDVTYYTDRKRNMYANREGDFDSWVYILSNPTLPAMLKIGYTKNTPEVRAQQISNATGVALPYKVEWAFHCYNGEQLEGEVHKYLESYRVNNHREFFQIPLDEAKKAVETLGQRYI